MLNCKTAIVSGIWYSTYVVRKFQSNEGEKKIQSFLKCLVLESISAVTSAEWYLSQPSGNTCSQMLIPPRSQLPNIEHVKGPTKFSQLV